MFQFSENYIKNAAPEVDLDYTATLPIIAIVL